MTTMPIPRPPFLRTRHDGVRCALLRKDGTAACIGDKLVSAETTYWLTGGAAPHKASSAGKVYVKDTRGTVREFYPSVFDLVWAAA